MIQESTGMQAPMVVHPGEGRAIDAFGSEILFKVTGEHSGGALTVGLAVVPPGEGPPPHVHHAESELFLIVEGRYGIFDGEGWTEVGPGGVVYLPRGSLHTFRNAGDTPARHWVLTTPSGFEDFYEKCAAVFTAGGPPDMERIMRICGEHHLELRVPGEGTGG